MYFPAQDGDYPKYVAILNGGTLKKADTDLIGLATSGKVKCSCRSRSRYEPRRLTLQCTTPDDTYLNYAVSLAWQCLAAIVQTLPVYRWALST